MLRPWLPEDGEWHVAQLGDPEIQRFTTESTQRAPNQFRREPCPGSRE